MADEASTPPPPAYPTSACTCGALVIWTVTTSGKRMPVDSTPADDGNIKLTHRGTSLPPLAVVTTNPAQLFGVRHRYRSHFANCPHAASHRRGRR
ncbi:hypothetical protein ABZS66_19085 [Dactylosporangium sp. NPDC005572]|uniref:hypothetical protein n=1 Tax=Dactylosporangium sp. NPDC005572 TaxID=3156889 RepID=UPI0033B089D3